MRYLSLCSGIEAASVAWEPLGFLPVGFAETNEFSSAVLAHHYPAVANFGDITKHQEWALDESAGIGIVCGGTPCQSFSVAGLRKGMACPRGNLALTYLAIVSRFRPRWILWENVPGILQTNGGRDFGAFVAGLAQCGYGWAYRILDSQYFGVAQRRRRVYVIGYSGGWAGAAAVLFERESLQGHHQPSRAAWHRFAKLSNVRLETNGSALGFHNRQTPLPSGHLAHPVGDRDRGLAVYLPAIANPLTARMHKGVNTDLREGQTIFSSPDTATGELRSNRLRRLTPLECERLQGFPDNYTRIAWRGRSPDECPDAPRYRALGNSWTVPVVRWIGERIVLVDEVINEVNRGRVTDDD